MSNRDAFAYSEYEFLKAKRKAFFSSVFAKITGNNQDLLSYDEARDLLKPIGESYQGQQTIKIENIVGSEGRYLDFDRRFLPRKNHIRNRWKSISSAYYNGVSLPVIQEYDLGGLYFVKDGNHRVSVAKRNGVKYIDAEVTKITTQINPGQAVDRDELKSVVIDFEREQFLKSLDLVEENPDIKIRFTAVGSFEDIVVHIAGHKKLLEQAGEGQIPYADAASSWYYSIYLPMVKLVRDSGALSLVPDRTESDFYV